MCHRGTTLRAYPLSGTPMQRPRSLVSMTLALAVSAGALFAQANQRRSVGGLDVAGMDRSVLPGDDFWEYANGTWLKRTEIPADGSSWSSDVELSELTDRRTADLIREVAASDAPARTD